MIIKDLTQIGNPLLRRRTKLVDKIHAKGIQKIIDNLIDSMRHHNLIGIAAPQIGEPLKDFYN